MFAYLVWFWLGTVIKNMIQILFDDWYWFLALFGYCHSYHSLKFCFHLWYKEWDGITVGLTIGIFTPIIDGSFLDEKPAVSLKKKEFKKTNILMGANKDEGFFFIFYYLSDMFKKQEDVFISREAFERSITELNVYANPLQRKSI